MKESKTTIQTTIGPLVLSEDRWRGALSFAYNDGSGISVDLIAPNLSDNAALIGGSRIKGRLGGYTGSNAADAAKQAELLAFVAETAAAIDRGNTVRRENAEAAKVAAEEEAERNRLVREQELKDRKETLLTELMGERVNVRQAGYKTMRQATIDVKEVFRWDRETRERVSDGYAPVLDYVNAADHARTQRISEIKRLDVKVPGTRRWKTVWEDGLDDLDEYDRDAVSLKPVQEQWDGSLEKVS